ncbi:MAG: hypothetical protein QHH19_03745 [Candidatus Thermoplasmatota archaeon]|nr:hypothetical protein [Candidatus Thermoplasmatota archaeon]
MPKDDGFYGSNKFFSSEWWYFDSIFNNNYSIHIGFTTVSKKNIMSFPEIEIYKDGKIVKKAIRRYLSKDFEISKQLPLVKLFNNNIFEFDMERFNSRGEWVYNVTPKIDDLEVNLKFISTTPGWKIEWEREKWIVALPKASVTGEIVVDGKRMKVNGIGYHDHNWSTNISRITNLWGWHWGKIAGKTLNIVWANIMKTSSEGDLLAVVNKDNQGYLAVNPENIYLKLDKFIRNHGRKMPTIYKLKIDDVVNDIPIYVDVKMEVQNIHRRFKKLLIAPYWRYHAKVKGVISLGTCQENIDKTQIMEFFRLI